MPEPEEIVQDVVNEEEGVDDIVSSIIIPIETEDGIKDMSYEEISRLVNKGLRLDSTGQLSDGDRAKLEEMQAKLSRYENNDVAAAAVHWMDQGYSAEQVIEAFTKLIAEHKENKEESTPAEDAKVAALERTVKELQSTVESEKSQKEKSANISFNDSIIIPALKEFGVDISKVSDAQVQKIWDSAAELFGKNLDSMRITQRQAKFLVADVFGDSKDTKTEQKKKPSQDLLERLRGANIFSGNMNSVKPRADNGKPSQGKGTEYVPRSERLGKYYQD